jgi:hypothetical protein
LVFLQTLGSDEGNMQRNSPIGQRTMV